MELEQEQAARHALANKVHKFASGVMALAGVSVVAIAGHALFVQLSANALTPGTATTERAPEPVVIVATGPAEEGAASVSAAPQETPGRADIATSAIVPAAEVAPGGEGPPVGHTPRHAPKFGYAYTDRGIFLYHLRKFTHAFAELAVAKRVGRHKAAQANANGNDEGRATAAQELPYRPPLSPIWSLCVSRMTSSCAKNP